MIIFVLIKLWNQVKMCSVITNHLMQCNGLKSLNIQEVNLKVTCWFTEHLKWERWLLFNGIGSLRGFFTANENRKLLDLFQSTNRQFNLCKKKSSVLNFWSREKNVWTLNLYCKVVVCFIEVLYCRWKAEYYLVLWRWQYLSWYCQIV